MLFKKGLRSVISIFLAAMLVVLAGCQSIAGIDMSKALVKNMTAKSAEGSMSLSMEMLMDAGYKPSTEDTAMIALLNSMKLTIDSIKTQDSTHLSMAGKLAIKAKEIPFKLAMNDKTVTVHIDGAKKPIVLNLDPTGGMLPADIMDQMKGLDKQVEALLPSFVQYFVGHSPDVKVATSKVSEKINGQSVQLTKLHIELNGTDLIKLIKGLLENIVKDEAGLKQLISSLYDVVIPIVKESMKADPSSAAFASILDDKETAITMVMPFIVETLKELSAEINLNDPELKELNALTLKLDLYLDNESYIRKTNADIELVLPPAAVVDGFKGFKLKVTSDQWNVNKPVKADVIDTTGGAIVIDPSQDDISVGKLLANFDKNSTVFKLIKDDLQLLNKDVQFYTVLEEETEDFFGDAYINKDQYTMVPTRALLEQLDADVKWDGAKQEITILDYLTETTIVMHFGSNKASVNGVEKEMQSAVVTKDAYSYVPLRFVATEFGFDIKYEDGIVTVTRK